MNECQKCLFDKEMCVCRGKHMNDELREQLAAIEHERWADWQRYMHSLCSKLGDFDTDYALVIPSNSVNHWERQIATPYAELSEKEKDSDREQVDRYWKIVQAHTDKAVKAARIETLQSLLFNHDTDGQAFGNDIEDMIEGLQEGNE